jgi:gluconokinase
VPHQPMALVLMGVSDSGKTSVGKLLSKILGWPFYDGDDFHSPENVRKMASGIPLDDNDRSSWLDELHNLIADQLARGTSMLLACSALKRSYRARLSGGDPRIIFVYLQGDFDLIYARMQARSQHYMKAGMLRSQFASLEPPGDAFTVNIDQHVEDIAGQIIHDLNLKPSNV